MNKNNSYTFKELSEKSKETALQQFIHYMKEKGTDYYEEHLRIADMMEEKFKESQIDVRYIDWDSEKGITLDSMELIVKEKFLKMHLSEEDFRLYEEVELANGAALVQRILQKEDGYGYVMEAEESNGYDLKDIMEFLAKYGSEDIKARYQPPLPTENDMTNDDFYNLYNGLYEVSLGFFEEFKRKLDPVAKELAEYVIETNRKHINFLGTNEYYLEKINKEDDFRFDIEGNLLKE